MVAGSFIALCACLGTAWVVFIATIFWLGYRNGFDWPVVGPTLLIGIPSALLGLWVFRLGRRLR